MTQVSVGKLAYSPNLKFLVWVSPLFLVACGKAAGVASGTGVNSEPISHAVPISASHAEESLLEGTCVVKPKQFVKLKSQVGGQIKAVLVEQGDKVEAGQVLLTIDTEDLTLRMRRQELELLRLEQRADLLELQLSRANKELEVVNSMAGNQFLPKFTKESLNLAEKKTELEDINLQKRLGKLEIERFHDQLRKATIKAPFSGHVLARTAEPGMVVSSGSEGMATSDVLFELGDLREMLGACVAKESDAVFLRTGLKAKLHIEGANRYINGSVRKVSPAIASDSGLSRREFHINLTGDMNSVLPGMHGTVSLLKDESSGLK